MSRRRLFGTDNHSRSSHGIEPPATKHVKEKSSRPTSLETQEGDAARRRANRTRERQEATRGQHLTRRTTRDHSPEPPHKHRSRTPDGDDEAAEERDSGRGAPVTLSYIGL
ncbi:hypothetical protein EMCRGX_G009244 [Ephydatia muelleri]